MSLQALAIEKLLFSLPVNEKSQEGIEKFISDYVANHPTVLTRCINKCGTYNVFWRERDPYVTAQMMVDATPDMNLISTFGTESDAIEWILVHGMAVMNNIKSAGDTPAVLMIVYLNGCAENGINHYMSSSGKHLSFAFDEAGYQMLLDEYLVMYSKGEYTEMIPYWLRYVKDDGEIAYGCSRDYLDGFLPYTYDYDETEFIIEFTRFQVDPVAYRRQKDQQKNR